jgi:hypothetical protein
LFNPDPDHDFYPSQIPDPEVKKGTESRIRNTGGYHKKLFSSWVKGCEALDLPFCQLSEENFYNALASRIIYAQ